MTGDNFSGRTISQKAFAGLFSYQSFPITSDRPYISGRPKVGPAKYPTTSDLQSGHFWSVFFLSFFWSHQVRIGHWPPTVWWNFFWYGKSFKFTGPTVQWIFYLIGKDCILHSHIPQGGVDVPFRGCDLWPNFLPSILMPLLTLIEGRW